MLHHPNFDPVAFSLGPLAVRWYGLMYLAGFAAGFWLGTRRIAQGLAPIARAQFDDLLFHIVLGVILGGRLGYVLFYKPAYYFAHPLEIFAIWQGGMSFHGGFLGVLLAAAFFAWRQRVNWWDLMDYVAPLVPVGLGAGRFANFINGELWGRVTDLPWGMVFRGAGELPRHPSQLYQMALEGFALFGFDNVSQKFVSTWIDNCGTGMAVGEGQLSADGKTLTWRYTYNCPLQKKPVVMRQVETATGADTRLVELFTAEPKTGKEFKMMRIEVERKK